MRFKKKTGMLLMAALALVVSPVLGTTASALQGNPNGTQRFIVTFDKSLDDKAKAAVRGVGAETVKELRLINGLVVAAPNATVAQKLARVQGVERVEQDILVSISAPSCSPWPSCKNTSTVTQPPQTLPWGVDRINADEAWGTSTGQGVKVAVIDTGIDRSHPDLTGNIAGGVNFVASGRGARQTVDPNAWNDDNGHGTHVAGTVAAVNNTVGVVGVAYEADVYGVKVLNSSGNGYVSDIISGVEWSVANDMDVINMSLSTSTHVQAFEDAVNAAYRADIVVVAAAGNVGDGNSATNEVRYPAKYASVIGVAATDTNNSVAGFSSDGAEVELAAPGVNVYSTTKGGTYGGMSGTSMAAPHVAGVAAAVMAAPLSSRADTDDSGSLSASEVRAFLNSTADDLGVAGRDVFYGHGLVDAKEAVTGQ